VTRAKLTHYGESGEARMVDVTAKEVTSRTAVARGFVRMRQRVVAAIRKLGRPGGAALRPPSAASGRASSASALGKGNPLEVARVAGIAAAKRTAELIPLCHPLPLTHIDVTARLCKNGVAIESRVTATARTGVEMEALAAVSVAALTVYDMCKALDKEMEITGVHLVEKIGGRSGHYVRRGRRGAGTSRGRKAGR
jgi:cyclic pyranopterin phosphate synthase